MNATVNPLNIEEVKKSIDGQIQVHVNLGFDRIKALNAALSKEERFPRKSADHKARQEIRVAALKQLIAEAAA